MSKFDDDIAAWVKKAKEEPHKVMTAAYLQLASAIIVRTPVKTGRARANWNAEINSPDISTTQQTDKRGTKAKREAARVATKAKPGDTLYLTNNLPYIRGLEYNRRSNQAPRGMVRVTAAEWEAALRRANR